MLAVNEPIAHPNGCQLGDTILNIKIVGDRIEPLFNRLTHIKAELINLQLENIIVDLVHVNEQALAGRNEMEVFKRLLSVLIIDSKFTLM